MSNNATSGMVFEVYSIMTDKQRLKPKNSSSLLFFASFDTLLDPRGAKEIRITSKIVLFEMIMRANIPVCHWAQWQYRHPGVAMGDQVFYRGPGGPSSLKCPRPVVV